MRHFLAVFISVHTAYVQPFLYIYHLSWSPLYAVDSPACYTVACVADLVDDLAMEN